MTTRTLVDVVFLVGRMLGTATCISECSVAESSVAVLYTNRRFFFFGVSTSVVPTPYCFLFGSSSVGNADM